MPGSPESTRPIKGLHVVLTRSADDTLATELAVLGATVQHIPAIARRAVPHTPIEWTHATAVLFSSPATLRFANFTRLPAPNCRVACVGNQTASAALSLGFTPQIVGREGAIKCIEQLRLSEGDTVVYPGPAQPLPATLDALRATGAEFEHVPVYETVQPADLQAAIARLTVFDVIIFASPSAVRNWRACGGPIGPVISIGPTTSHAARKHGFTQVVEAKSPSTAGIKERIIQAYEQAL